MIRTREHNAREKEKAPKGDLRLRVVVILFFLFALILCFRLFSLMIMQHGFYTALAVGSQEIYAQLVPDRGEIFLQDSRTKEIFPLAMNRDVFIVFVDTRDIGGEETIDNVLEGLDSIFSFDDERKEKVIQILHKKNDPYEPIEKGVVEEVVEELRTLELPGIGFVRQKERYYPEKNLAAHVVGFVGKDNEVGDIGRYGVEGYWQTELAGTGGFVEAAKSLAGKWITLAGRSLQSAEDGVDIVLTIDRTLQFTACERLRGALEEYGATSASLIIMDPISGAIRAMCSLPDFDPNTYNEVENISVYNNTSIFTPYEPGSIFKPITMVAALEEGVVGPDTYFYDSGEREANCTKPIKNAGENIYEDTTMTGVLENSINTGMVYVVEQLGKKRFRNYLEEFGFGVKQGVELDTEVAGTIETLYEIRGDSVDCYTATASFGQGITATPLQMVSAFSAIANGGTLMKPYVIEEVRHIDGKVEKTVPREVKRVVSGRAASLLGAMLVKVIDSGQAGAAAVNGYYVAGKTGTAQIAGRGGYTEETNHSFIGFAPVDNPKFVMIVKFEKPARKYSSSTAAPVFGEIAKFILEYYHVAPVR